MLRSRILKAITDTKTARGGNFPSLWACETQKTIVYGCFGSKGSTGSCSEELCMDLYDSAWCLSRWSPEVPLSLNVFVFSWHAGQILFIYSYFVTEKSSVQETNKVAISSTQNLQNIRFLVDRLIIIITIFKARCIIHSCLTQCPVELEKARSVQTAGEPRLICCRMRSKAERDCRKRVVLLRQWTETRKTQISFCHGTPAWGLASHLNHITRY